MNGKTVCVFAPAVKDIIASIVQKNFLKNSETYLQKINLIKKDIKWLKIQ